MEKINLSIFKQKDGFFTIDYVERNPGNENSFSFDCQGAYEIWFDFLDEGYALFINDAYFNHKQRSLKSDKPIKQQLKIAILKIDIITSAKL